MVSQLLSPSQPKNASDGVVLAILGLHIAALVYLPSGWRKPLLGLAFLFWRGCYNAGIGYLLQIQSDDKRMVYWAQKLGIFQLPTTGKNPHPRLFNIIKRELETKIPEDYKTEEAPLEYNTWLLFRRLVDLILMCDFVSYCCFAIACSGSPEGESAISFTGRWIGGLSLIIFNVWVKLDAHRVVKDYAWYWGDFFFLVDQELTFDGVFEMAPHPMYSVGYAGYYGISLLAASYKVLLISLVAHAAQFAFLMLVENPHIEKTYNPPPKRRVEDSPTTPEEIVEPDGTRELTQKPSAVHRILGLQNTDLHRVVDVAVFLLHLQMFTLAVFTPNSKFSQFCFVLNALIWRLWYTIGIGFILNRQSSKRSWTRHFIKYGDDVHEGWRQWKGIYHISMHMCYSSFVAVAWKMYHLPENWNYGSALMRHVLGAALITLHLWTVSSIYDSLGEFGWFYGDFFFDQASKLTYDGIYRFLNNPERFFGLAGLWGFAFLTYSRAMFALALVSHVLSLFFIQFVERPHMQKLYGESLRNQSGLSKGFRRALPQPIAELQGTMDRRIEQTADFIEEFIEAARPKLAAGVGTMVRDATSLFRGYPARIAITRVADDLAAYNPADYSITIEGTPTSAVAELESRSGRESSPGREPPRRDSTYKTQRFEYGAPVTVKWTAPKNHSKKDWIGLYMVSDNSDREITRISSRGRWVATNARQYDSVRADSGIVSSDLLIDSDGIKEALSGQMTFEGDKLWWTTGVFEFRYHHAGKHNVMAISNPFELCISKFDFDEVEPELQSRSDTTARSAVEKALLPVIRNCFDRDNDIAPSAVDELFGSLVERNGKYAKRVVFAVQQMFGIEFAPEVVQADGSVKNLAWRICTAKKALVSFTSLDSHIDDAGARDCRSLI